MAHEIIWTEKATEDFDGIVQDLSDYNSIKYAIKFVNIFYEKLNRIDAIFGRSISKTSGCASIDCY